MTAAFNSRAAAGANEMECEKGKLPSGWKFIGPPVPYSEIPKDGKFVISKLPNRVLMSYKGSVTEIYGFWPLKIPVAEICQSVERITEPRGGRE